MRRREFARTSLTLLGSAVLTDSANAAGRPTAADFPETPGLTDYVGRFVATTRYEDIPQGVIELRSFFSEAVNGPEGGGMSLLTLKRVVKKMIDEEDSTKPLTDEQIAKKLEENGIQVTRRTVAKYREDMRIPSTHQRRVKS